MKRFFRFFRFFCIKWLARQAGFLPLEPCVILAPHPDDETFGCGQLISGLRRQGHAVHVILVSDGSASHQGCCTLSKEETRDMRYRSLRLAWMQLGGDEEHLHFLHLPDGRLAEALPEIEMQLEQLIESLQVENLLVPHPQEGWGDHTVTTVIGEKIAARLQLTLYYYCVWFYFSMPFRRFHRVKWNKALRYADPTDHARKLIAVQQYLTSSAPCGVPYTGKLPKELLNMIPAAKELYFKR